MADTASRLRVLCVGSNPHAAFLSWRFRASNACENTLYWPNHFEAISSFGIEFKSDTLRSERFKPDRVVRNIQDAVNPTQPFDYIFLQAGSHDVYDLADLIQSVVTPTHTCIIADHGHYLDTEDLLISRFPRNMVASIVSNIHITQSGPAEFAHHGTAEFSLGSVRPNDHLPIEAQQDMTESFALTLEAGSVQCKVSKNIRQDQWAQLVGPMAFYPFSVLMEEPNLSTLASTAKNAALLKEVIDELILIAQAACHIQVDPNFREATFKSMQQEGSTNPLYQNFIEQRPMTLHLYCHPAGRIAREHGISCPRLDTIHIIIERLNEMEMQKNAMEPDSSRSTVNQNAGPRRSQPNGYQPPMSSGGYAPGPQPRARAPSVSTQYDELANIANYGDLIGVPSGSSAESLDPRAIVHAGDRYGRGSGPSGPPPRPRPDRTTSQIPPQRDMYRPPAPGQVRPPAMQNYPPRPAMQYMNRPPMHQAPGLYDEDEDDAGADDFPPYQQPRRGGPPPVNPDMVDMMSLTNRRTRKSSGMPSQVSMRSMINGMDLNGPGGPGGPRPGMSDRTSTWTGPQPRLRRDRASMGFQQPTVGVAGDRIQDNPMVTATGSPYAMVDTIHNARTNSLTAQRLDEVRAGPGAEAGFAGGPYPPPNRGAMNNGFGGGARPGMAAGQGMRGQGPYRGMNTQSTPSLPNGMSPGMVPGANGKVPNYRSVTGSASASVNSGRDNSHGSNGSSSSSLERNQLPVHQ